MQRGWHTSSSHPVASLEAEGGCLRPITLQTQLLSRFWYILGRPTVGMCSTNRLVGPVFSRTSRITGTAVNYRPVGFTAFFRDFHFWDECCAKIPLPYIRPFNTVNILIDLTCWVSAWCVWMLMNNRLHRSLCLEYQDLGKHSDPKEDL